MALKSRFCEVCPRKLKGAPAEPCPLAMEAIHAIQSGTYAKTPTGCEWHINSEQHSYCFWNYTKGLDETAADKEIRALLLISQIQLEKSFQSGVEKLKEIKDTDIIKDIVESIGDADRQGGSDNSIYLPTKFSIDSKKEDEEPEVDSDVDAADEEAKRPKRLKASGQPVHRSGKKVDVFGLYSKKTLDRMKKDKEKK